MSDVEIVVTAIQEARWFFFVGFVLWLMTKA